jgi:hypothetical protein
VQTSQPIIDEKYLSLIFYNVEDILNVNTQFVTQLTERIEQQQSDNVGNIFLNSVSITIYFYDVKHIAERGFQLLC